jgi:bifunctional enzyme CysN/CysC
MGRFVIVDNYEISGGGIILENIITDQSLIGDYVKRREQTWVRSEITPEKRAFKLQHKAVLVLITGEVDSGKQRLAKAIEESLFEEGKNVYFLGVSNQLLHDLSGAQETTVNKVQHLQQLGETAHVLTDAGLILVTSVSDMDAYELNILRELNKPARTVVINVGENRLAEDVADLVLPKTKSPDAALAQCLEVIQKHIGLDPEYTI